MAVREATHADLPALLGLIRAYADFYESSPSDEGIEEMARSVIGLPEDEAFMLVAVDEGSHVVGFAACCWKWSSLRGARIVVLDDLFVDPRSRGAGHADALIEAAADVARRHGGPVLTWLTQTDNHRAQAVYNRVGAVPADYMEYELEL